MKLNLNIKAEEHIKQYYKKLAEKTMGQFEIASEARSKGFDASTAVETVPVADLADRTETIIGPVGIAKRYREAILETKGERMQAIFKIFREIIEQKWCKIENPAKRVEQAIKTALVLNTEGVVVAPLDGVPQILISKNPDGSQYVDIYYAGPIRAAGGTSAVLPLILGDYARQLLGLDRYKPTEDEVERYVEECQIYEEIVSRQYKLTDEEVRRIARGCPVCINGEPTEEREVSIHRNLGRIPGNRIRGGMCLVISEGIAMKARKIMKFSKMLGLDWSWLEDVIKVEKSDASAVELKPNWKYLEGVAAGRPIFSYPLTPGGFRLRYGRARNTGIMGKGMHPATMHVLNGFVATATQIKVERPGKAAGICPVDSIEGPIVRLLSGNVLKVNSLEEAEKISKKIDRILFLGDLLISFGDFRYSAHPLVPVGYCSEWWKAECKKLLGRLPIDEKEIENDLRNHASVSIERAFELSGRYGLPLHPNALFYYGLLEKDEVIELVRFLEKGEIAGGYLKVERNDVLKKILEKAGIPHSVEEGTIVFGIDESTALKKTLALGQGNDLKAIAEKSANSLELIGKLSGLTIRDKAGTFIGARMGRPEASRPRKMVGNPHVLFPIGLYGGNTRSINKAMKHEAEETKKGSIEVEISLLRCPKCNGIKTGTYCHECNQRTLPFYRCANCSNESQNKKCSKCGKDGMSFSKRAINIDEIVHVAAQRLGIQVPELIKGVKGIINRDKITEPLEKGLLRAKHDVHIFRDATIRYELINAPLTHFKPSEIGADVEKLKQLGYAKDINGKPLDNAEQVLEIFPQDIVIHENAAEFFVRVSQFVDELLDRFYGVGPYFNMKKKEDFAGELLLGLAPHTSAAIVGRVIGFTKARACFAHPYFHQTKRRNIDGDQDSLMLLMDGLLNFSQHYLPDSRGGRMDAPLVFTVALKPTEIDEECYNMETCAEYPLELYEKAQKMMPAEIETIELVAARLDKKGQYSGFSYTHDTSCFDCAPTKSKYVELNTMEEKIKNQAKLQGMIAAVDAKDALERVMVSHFIPDIIGNARSFSRQQFRCTNCNEKFRRIPLDGRCTKCGKSSIILTIAEGSVRKYVAIAKEIANSYGLSDYLRQRLDLIEEEINSIFRSDKAEQKSLFEYV